MCTFLFIVGALMGLWLSPLCSLLQRRLSCPFLLTAHFGHNEPGPQTATSYVISGHKSATYGIIVCSYFFVCSFACSELLKARQRTRLLTSRLFSMGPVSVAYRLLGTGTLTQPA